MNCPHCESPIPAEDINIGKLLAKCRGCDAVFSFDAAVSEKMSGPQSPLGEGRESLMTTRPPFVREEVAGDRLSFQYRWYSPSILLLLTFCVIWNALLLFWYALGTGASGQLSALGLIFPVIHVAVGLCLAYFVAAGILNRTTISVDRSSLNVHHGPLPFWKGINLPVVRLRQLFCRREGSGNDETSPGQVFSIHAILDDDSRLVLLSLQNERDLVLYLEQRIEDFLGIVDVPVSGELPK